MPREMRLRWFVICLFSVMAVAVAVVEAQAPASTADTVTALFSAKSVADRAAAIEELENADPKDPLVPYALGAAGFFQSLEKLAVGLHRHGFESPQSFMLPLLRLPVPQSQAGAPEL